MILSKIWERKIFFNILRLTGLFLASVFIVVIFIDLSIHGAKIFSHSKTSLQIILNYYLNLFFIQFNLFLALTFMLAIIKILSDMNIHHELTALRMAGISAKMISRPFIILAILFTCSSYLNYQYLYPNALNFKDNFKEKFLKKTTYKKKLLPNVIYLEDSTKIVYQKYDLAKKTLFDVYFIIKSNSDIWHAKYLYLNENEAIGNYVDHLVRKDDFFEKESSYLTYEFKDIKLNKNTNMLIPFENRTISSLYKQCMAPTICQKEKNELLSYLNFKLAMPLTPILIVMAIFPFLIAFSKNISIFFISAFAIFGFVIFHTSMESALILAENSAISPYIIMWLPVLLIFSIFGRKYLRI